MVDLGNDPDGDLEAMAITGGPLGLPVVIRRSRTDAEIERAYRYWNRQLRNARNDIAETSFARGCLDTLDWLLDRQTDHGVPHGEQKDQLPYGGDSE